MINASANPLASLTQCCNGAVNRDTVWDLDFKAYTQPPIVQRGSCRECGKPALEKIAIPIMPKLVVVPSENIIDSTSLPDPDFHIFYDKRVADRDDGLKKYHGFIPSQFAFSAQLIKAMLFGS